MFEGGGYSSGEQEIISEFYIHKNNDNFKGMQKTFFEYDRFVNTCIIMRQGYGDRAPYNEQEFNQIKIIYEKEEKFYNSKSQKKE